VEIDESFLVIIILRVSADIWNHSAGKIAASNLVGLIKIEFNSLQYRLNHGKH